MGFDINNFLNAESKKEVKSDWKPVKLSVHKLRPAAGKENFYHMDDKEIQRQHIRKGAQYYICKAFNKTCIAIRIYADYHTFVFDTGIK